ncbi:response regulator transcription factor [Rhodoferax sp. GW822-FHT02A01]|uniref:response regulator transcription factor n=1 Tax=Rhodoferax sp. GW822-FHT02A01 TaxID=3141537 RepID=UPI00315DE973
MIKVVIAEDHAIVRNGVKQILALAQGIEVVGEAVDGAELQQMLRSLEFDVLLTDLNMPGLSGPDLIARIHAHFPDKPIIVLSMHNTVQAVSRALKAGARGYVTKGSEPEILIAAIRKVAQGGRFVAPEMAQQMVFDSARSEQKAAHEGLSDRELEVLRLLVKGQSNNEIASALCVSNKTVSSHKTRILEKLEVSSLADLVLYAVEHGLRD